MTIHYIKSLHRPYNSRLKTVKWVCEFAKQNNDTRIQEFKYSFYIYIVNTLYEYYESSNLSEIIGIPSREAIRTVYTEFNDSSVQEKIAIVEKAMKKKSRDKDDFDKKVFSTYKAASYFITLAQKHFNLMDRKNRLTEEGMELASLKNTDFIALSLPESNFFLSVIAKKDLVLFLMQISFNRYKKLDKWNLEEYIDMLIQFINGFPELNLLKYNRRSLANYSVVRSKWIEELKVLKPDGKLTSKAANVIKSTSPEIFDLYEDYYRRWNCFEEETVKPFENLEYREQRKEFIRCYKLITSKSTIDGFDYVNLYDIKRRMKLSHEKMQRFLERLTSNRNRKHNIYFQNIVKSIDGRKRFTINDTPVITVRIDGV